MPRHHLGAQSKGLFPSHRQVKRKRKRGKILEDGQVEEEKIDEYEIADLVNLEDFPGSPTDNINSTQNILESLNQIEVMEQAAPLVQPISDMNQPGFARSLIARVNQTIGCR